MKQIKNVALIATILVATLACSLPAAGQQQGPNGPVIVITPTVNVVGEAIAATQTTSAFQTHTAPLITPTPICEDLGTLEIGECAKLGGIQVCNLGDLNQDGGITISITNLILNYDDGLYDHDLENGFHVVVEKLKVTKKYCH